MCSDLRAPTVDGAATDRDQYGLPSARRPVTKIVEMPQPRPALENRAQSASSAPPELANIDARRRSTRTTSGGYPLTPNPCVLRLRTTGPAPIVCLRRRTTPPSKRIRRRNCILDVTAAIAGRAAMTRCSCAKSVIAHPWRWETLYRYSLQNPISCLQSWRTRSIGRNAKRVCRGQTASTPTQHTSGGESLTSMSSSRAMGDSRTQCPELSSRHTPPATSMRTASGNGWK